jgi:NADPH:quinone reductase-like Zn-dependent oxidoreductase
VCDTRHVDLLTTLGADKVVDYLAQDFTQDDRRYQAVIDAVGKTSYAKCKTLLTPTGMYVSSELGDWAQNPLLAIGLRFSRGRRVLFPIPPRHDHAGTEFLGHLVATGEFTPVIDRAFDLDDIVEAYRYVETEQKTGNVIVNIDPHS